MAERGALRTYLGTAPGVGKTYTMLADARDRAAAGEKVVVGWLEHNDRPGLAGQLEGLEVIEPRTVSYRNSTFGDLDLDAIVASDAELVLIDELALRRVDSTRHRWQDVEDLLAGGLAVFTTMNIANLLSVRDYAASLTDVGAVESVPDEFVRSGEVVLVDMPADALRQRIASGAVFSCDQVGGALANYFRASNLEALSELGQGWINDNVVGVGDDLLVRRGLVEPNSGALVLAGDSGSEWGEWVIRRAALTARENDAQLLVVHVRASDGFSRRRNQRLDEHRYLTEDLGGTYIEIPGESPPEALASEAGARGASKVVVGRDRSRLSRLVRGSISSRLDHLLPAVPITEVTEEVRSQLQQIDAGSQSFEPSRLTA